MSITHLEKADLRAKNSTNDRSVKLPIPSFVRLPYRALDRLSPKLAGEVGRRLFFRPTRLGYTDLQRQVLDLADERHLGGVATYSWGSGPTVLLVHGWGGHAGQMTPFVEPLIDQGYRVVAVDMPAHGRSDGKLSSVVHFSIAIRQAARYFGRVHGVVSHSLGGGGVIHALGAGMPAKRAVLIASQAQFHDYWRMFRNGLGMSDAAWRHMVTASEAWLGVPFAEIHPGFGARRLNVSALILHGAKDRISPLKEGRELSKLWPGARLEEFDAGHTSILRDPAVIRSAAAFIRD